MDDPEEDVLKMTTLLRITQLKLERAERHVIREQRRLHQIVAEIRELSSEKQAMATDRAAIMTALDGRRLAFDDLCRYQARILLSDRQREALRVQGDKLEHRRARQAKRLDSARLQLIRLQQRLDQWAELVGEQQLLLTEAKEIKEED